MVKVKLGDHLHQGNLFLFMKGNSILDLKTGIWTASTAGTYWVEVTTENFSKTPIYIENGFFSSEIRRDKPIGLLPVKIHSTDRLSAW